MSEQWPGGLITKTPVTPSGPYEASTASGVWTLEEAYQWKGDGLWPTAGNTLAYYTSYGILSGQGWYGKAVSVDSSSNIYVSGWLSQAGSTYADDDIVWTAKYPSDGSAPTWQRSAQNTSLSHAEVKAGSVIDSTGDIIVAGSGYDASDDFSIILKWDTDGVFQWGRNFGDSTGRHAQCAGIGIDSNDNIYLWTNSTTTGYAAIVKWNSAGAIQFQKSATTAGASVGNLLSSQDGDLTVDSSDYIIPAGLTQAASGSGLQVGSIARISAAGVVDWSREISHWTRGAQAVVTDSSDNIYVGASAWNSTVLPYISKFNSSGTRQWARKIAGSAATGHVWSQSIVKRIAVDSSDNVYMIAGTDLNRSGATPAGPNNECIAIFKYSSAGVLQWARYVQGNLYSMGSDSRITIDGSDIIIVSRVSIDSADAGNTSMFILKIPTDGSKTGDYTNPTYTGFTLTYGILLNSESEDTTSSVQTGDYTLATTTITEAATGMTSATGTLISDNDPL